MKRITGRELPGHIHRDAAAEPASGIRRLAEGFASWLSSPLPHQPG